MMNRRSLVKGLLTSVAAFSLPLLPCNGAFAKEPRVQVEWKQYWHTENSAYILIALWVQAEGLRHVVGAKQIHFNEYDLDTEHEAFGIIFEQFKAAFSKEPWYEEARELADKELDNFYLE